MKQERNGLNPIAMCLSLTRVGIVHVIVIIQVRWNAIAMASSGLHGLSKSQDGTRVTSIPKESFSQTPCIHLIPGLAFSSQGRALDMD